MKAPLSPLTVFQFGGYLTFLVNGLALSSLYATSGFEYKAATVSCFIGAMIFSASILLRSKMDMQNLAGKIKSRVARAALRMANAEVFERDFLREIPPELVPAAKWIYSRDIARAESVIRDMVEGFRRTLASSSGEASSYSSPHSGEFSLDEKGHSVPGEFGTSSLSGHAKTGVSGVGGIFIRRLIDGVGINRVLELGTNTGFSGSYILSSENEPHLVTVEGSSDLCAIARSNMSSVSGNFTLMNAMFDDAIDELISKGEKFDLIFNDGQHESGAVLHYLERCIPLIANGGWFLFDDIYWSDDMNRAWKKIVSDSRFCLTFDFAEKGLARIGKGEKVHYDICEYLGRPNIYRKGW